MEPRSLDRSPGSASQSRMNWQKTSGINTRAKVEAATSRYRRASRPRGFHPRPLPEPGVNSRLTRLPSGQPAAYAKLPVHEQSWVFTRDLLEENAGAAQSMVEAFELALDPDGQRLIDIANHGVER